MSKFSPKLASPTAVPPTSSSYWVAPGLLLAGTYPGDPDPAEHDRKVKALLGAGIRLFVNLMEENETDHAGRPFMPYQDLAAKICPEVACARYPIPDLAVPTASRMASILDVIDSAIGTAKPVYVHCWGGVGRTGTVIRAKYHQGVRLYHDQCWGAIMEYGLERIAVLRGQVVHGASTRRSRLNRESLQRCRKVLESLLPIVLRLVIEHRADDNWPPLCYPPIEE